MVHILQLLLPNLIIEQGVQHIMELRGKYYPDLVRIFYFNLKVCDGVFQTRVKGVDIVLDNKIWTNVAKVPVLANSQIIPSDFPHLNKIMVYQSLLRNPRQRNNRLFLAGGLKMEERLLHYIIVWILCPKGSNHAQCSETDLIVMHAITQSIPLNWPHLIQTIMLKAKRLDLVPLPYPLLVSKICEYKGVDISNEHFEHVLPGHKIGENSLRQMGFIQQGLSYIHPEDAIGEQASEDDDANIPMPDPTNVAGPSQIHKDYSLESLSRQITEMARLQNTRHEEISKETLSVELVKYCYGDRGIAGSSLVRLRKGWEEEVILREVFGGSVSSFVKIQRRSCFISCGIKRGVF
ncbi:hypothetical protein LR48_Vigan07g120200 [Vigna angularis]|uniref:Putative plant transposon protein domain-containing protein n=1 Tax=Phaseolus angularis TaxID=3914 RepID=A0A0L9UXL3_PHAAN|nr:hypothetical protein LR48_Vigan07g120200 [Vigna angularis]